MLPRGSRVSTPAIVSLPRPAVLYVVPPFSAVSAVVFRVGEGCRRMRIRMRVRTWENVCRFYVHIRLGMHIFSAFFSEFDPFERFFSF